MQVSERTKRDGGTRRTGSKPTTHRGSLATWWPWAKCRKVTGQRATRRTLTSSPKAFGLSRPPAVVRAVR